MLLSVIELAFDPVLRIGSLDIRWQTIGLTVALLGALALAARRASHLPPRAAALAPPAALDSPSDPAPPRLRLDDLAYIVLGSVPGAVVGGRLAHGLVYWDAYAAEPLRLLDAGVGSLSLAGAVLGGALSGAYVCRLLAAPLRRWADAAAIPLLLAIGLGKLAQLLGGSGQGAPFDGPWAVAFLGDGPWHSLSPALPAHPAQAYEAIWALIGVIVAVQLGRRPARRVGIVFAVALAWFLAGRVLIGFFWRDEAWLGPLNGEQVVAAAVLLGLLGALARRGLRRPQAPAGAIVSG